MLSEFVCIFICGHLSLWIDVPQFRAPRKFWGLNSQTPNQTFDYAIFVSILQRLTTSQVFCKLFFQIHVVFQPSGSISGGGFGPSKKCFKCDSSTEGVRKDPKNSHRIENIVYRSDIKEIYRYRNSLAVSNCTVLLFLLCLKHRRCL